MDRFSDLEAFIAVIEQGSFSAAAEQLGIARSVVSRRVSRLEKRLGSQLIRRTTRRLTLTEAGSDFHRQTRRLLEELEDAEQRISEQNQALRGRLRLAAPMSFGLRHLARALTCFLNEHPAVQLDLDLNDRQIDLVEEGFDMAVRIGQLEDSSLVARRLGTIRSVTCAAPAYLERHGVPTHPGELAKHRALQYTHLPAPQQWRFIGPDGKALVAQPSIVMRSNNGESIAEMSAGGLGIASGPTFIFNDYCQRGELVPILRDWQRPESGLYAVFPPGRMMPRRVRTLADYLIDRYGDHPEWDSCLGLEAQ